MFWNQKKKSIQGKSWGNNSEDGGREFSKRVTENWEESRKISQSRRRTKKWKICENLRNSK